MVSQYKSDETLNNLVLISIVTSFQMENNLDNSNSNQYMIKRAIPVSASILSNFARFQGMVFTAFKCIQD